MQPPSETQPSTIDTLLHARWILTVADTPLSDEQASPESKHPVLEGYAIAIDEDRIIDILPEAEAESKYQPRSEKFYPHHLLMPGLINAHTHAAMSLFRGLADDLQLMDWLENHIWPAEAAFVNETFVQQGVELAVAEMLRGGTTCFNDMYFFPDVTARVAADAGIRACVGLIVIDFPTVWANNPEEYIDKGLGVRDHFMSNELITTAFAPHAPYTVADESLQKIATLANELDLNVHMHIHETAFEVESAVKASGKRPLQRLDELNLLSPSLLAVHMTQLTTEEIERIAVTGSHVIHCPESNMKLASGICPVTALQAAGVNTALATDSASSNNDLDMFSEMRSAALLAKISTQDATALPAGEAVKMATINAARALGIDGITGSLEVGKSADIIAVDFDTIETSPVYDPVSHLVYCCSRDQVTDVWVAGKHRLNNRQLTSLDEQAIKQQASEISLKVRRKISS